MTDRKTLSLSQDTMPSEPLYEREGLSDSDGVFLAELDLVLTADEPGKVSPADVAMLARTDRADNATESLGPVQTADAAGLEHQDEAKLELISDIVKLHQNESAISHSAPESPEASPGATECTLDADRPVAEKPPTPERIREVDRGRVQAPIDKAIEYAWKGGGARWLGAIAILGIVAFGMGGVGLWRVVDIEDRLSLIEPVSTVTAAPVLDTASVENARRIADLERHLGRSMEHMQADLEALGASLAKELEGRNERLDGDLATLNGTLSALHEQLRSAQELMAATGKTDNQPANTPIAPDASSTQSAPDPGPPTEGVVALSASVSPAGEKTSQWSVNLFAADRKDKTEKELSRFRAQDVPAEVFSVVNKGKVWYRIAVRGFDSFEKASVYAETLRSKPGMSGIWVGRN